MKKIFILLILITTFLFSQTKLVEAKYKINYSGFLPLGVAHTYLKIDGDSYEIEVKAHAIGLAKILSNNRTEIYKSYGKIIDKEFYPSKFIKIKSDNSKKRVRMYKFLHKEKKVFVDEKREKKLIKYDSNFKKTFTIKKEKREEFLDYYASQDVLSLFFNLKNILFNYEKNINYTKKAIGANKTKGEISIILPSEKIEELNTPNDIHLIVYINQKIFSSKKGELLISLNQDGFCNKAILKDVLLFGDIVGKMVEFKERN